LGILCFYFPDTPHVTFLNTTYIPNKILQCQLSPAHRINGCNSLLLCAIPQLTTMCLLSTSHITITAEN